MKKAIAIFYSGLLVLLQKSCTSAKAVMTQQLRLIR